MKVILAGGGRYGQRLANMLVKEKNSVVLIEKNEAKAEELSGEINALVLHGDATNMKILKNAGAEKCDAIVSLTGSDATNMKVCEAARELGAKTVFSRINDTLSAKEFEQIGVPTINAEETAAYAFKSVLDNRAVLADVAGGRYHLVEMIVEKDSELIGRKFGRLSKHIIPMAIFREDKLKNKTNAKIEENDLLIFCVLPERMKEKLF